MTIFGYIVSALPPTQKKKNDCLGGLKRVPAMDNCLGAYYVYCPKTRLLKIKYGSKGSISNVDLGLFKPNNQLIFSFVTFRLC